MEQGVVDNIIVFQKPFPGAARTELESQLQRAVKVSAKGKHVKCKMDLERCLFWDPAGNRVPRPAEFARHRGRALVEARHVWLSEAPGSFRRQSRNDQSRGFPESLSREQSYELC